MEETASSVAQTLSGHVAASPFGHEGDEPVVIDARGQGQEFFESWDDRREELLALPPKVVLLNVAAGRELLRTAPHTASVAGGVMLPAENTARLVETEDEEALGRRELNIALEEVGEEQFRGCLVGVDLYTKRLYGRPGEDPRHLAQEDLDFAVLYVEYVP